MINDSISDFFTRIRNGSNIRRDTVFIPYNKTNKSLAKILARHGFINIHKISSESLTLKLKYEKDQPIIVKIQRLSRPGCRLYVNARNIPQICGKLGIVFLSTSYGIISDREAYNLKVGGEIIGFVS
uniref:Small ribosomal subunit protein uS8c n=1 Tax=Flabellia petiolata TaxID=189428 RepID=A0A386AX58_9CHLO|nr:ribosomal protein S8 [Flabellia petiolata]